MSHKRAGHEYLLGALDAVHVLGTEFTRNAWMQRFGGQGNEAAQRKRWERTLAALRAYDVPFGVTVDACGSLFLITTAGVCALQAAVEASAPVPMTGAEKWAQRQRRATADPNRRANSRAAVAYRSQVRADARRTRA